MHETTMHDIHYTLQFEQRARHIVGVCLHIAKPDLQGQVLWMPNWIPGSYMIRDFARQIVHIEVWADGQPWYMEKLGKNRWRCAPVLGSLEVRYQVYGFEVSVRSMHVDTSHAYFNGAALFLAVEGQEASACQLELLPFAHEVEVLSSMRPLAVDSRGFGRYRAVSYAELIDHPFEIGVVDRLNFEVAGTPHQLVFRHAGAFDRERFLRDVSRICATQIQFFGGQAPFSSYVFLIQVQEQGYGGLEHAASSSLLIPRAGLPHPWDPEVPKDAYVQVLGLISHEYFHAWNVKRLRPRVYAPLALEREMHTTLLWFFEGVTSYYDDWFLYRADIITEEHYLKLLGLQISRYLRQPGWRYQSLADSSFDAWTRYYRQDENSVNVQTSYYVHGSLLALCLDLFLRQKAKRYRSSLDALMQSLWQQRDQYADGLSHEDLLNQLRRLSHRDVVGFLEHLLFDHLELPLQSLLSEQGIVMDLRLREPRSDTGTTLQVDLGGQWQAKDSGLQLTQVLYNGALELAGLSVGDLIVAIDGYRATESRIALQLAYAQPGSLMQLHVFQQDQLQIKSVQLQAAPLDTCVLTLKEGKRALSAAHSWLLGQVTEEVGQEMDQEGI